MTYPMNVNETDRQGYKPIHRAIASGEWKKIKKLADKGASIDVIAPSGASLKDFAEGLRKAELYSRLLRYRKGLL